MLGRGGDNIYRRVEELLRVIDGLHQLWVQRGPPWASS
jgi:hypothetical protein